MAEESMFWADGIGDGGPYSEDQLRLLYDGLAGSEDANRGVLVFQGDQLAPSSTGNNNIRMAIGRAVVDGTVYENDAILDIVTASPAIGTTGRRLVLQKDWAARTVRAVIITSADGVGAIPALTQNDGTIWEIPIASFTITIGGVIGALTDQREFCEGTGGLILDRDLSQVDIVNDGTIQSIYSFAIPAGALGATGGVRLTIGGDYLNNTGGAVILDIRIVLGATTVLASQLVNITASANRRKWRLDIWFMNSAAAAQKWNASFAMTPPTAEDFGIGDTTAAQFFLGAGQDVSAEDTSGALTLDVTVDHSVADPLLSIRKEIALLELIAPA